MKWVNDPCTSRTGKPKRGWPNEAAAKFVAGWVEHRDGKRMRWYQCWKCGKWHTTTVGGGAK